MDACLLHFDDEAASAARLAAATGLEARCIERHRFPDGEIKVRLPLERAPLPQQVVLLRSLAQPNEKLVELLLAAQTARSLGVRALTLVAPYLAYMRQDIAFTPGEAVSQRIVGGFLAGLFNAVLTVDPHLHRVHTLAEAIPLPEERALALSAAPLLADCVVAYRPHAWLVGPDAESEQWVAQAAARHGLRWAVCGKRRHGDRRVEVTLPEGVNFAGAAVVLIDDVASTGHTLAEAARGLHAAGAASVDVAVTHALFAGDALALLRAAGVGRVWSSDSVPHETNAVPLAPLLAQGLAALPRALLS